MRYARPLIFILLLVPLVAFSIPHQAHAANATFFGPIIPQTCHCDSQPNPSGGAPLTTAPAWGCVLQVLQNCINLLVSLGIILMILYLALAGAQLITSAGSPGAREQAKQRLLNVVVGLVVVLSAWLIVDFVMKTLYNDQNAQFGPWNAILAGDGTGNCIVATNSQAIVGGSIDLVTGSTTPQFTSGDIQSRICSAAGAYTGTPTAGAPNTNNGKNACAWAVNQVLTLANVANIGSTNVQGMENALKGGRGSQVAQAQAVCGDIVIEAGDSHVGICLNSGCTSVISNSSSLAQFKWISGIDFQPSYSEGNGRIYRVTN